MKNGERLDFLAPDRVTLVEWNTVTNMEQYRKWHLSQHESCRRGTIHDLRDPPYGGVELLPMSLVLPTLDCRVPRMVEPEKGIPVGCLIRRTVPETVGQYHQHPKAGMLSRDIGHHLRSHGLFEYLFP
jgi:hypothetical protein